MTTESFTIHVPMKFQRRGGRKLIVVPEGAPTTPPPRFHVSSVLIRALARAFRWRVLLEEGTYTTIKEIAAKERLDPSYVGDVLRLTLLAPDIVEMILDGRQPQGLEFQQLRKSFPLEWHAQRKAIRLGSPAKLMHRRQRTMQVG